MPSLRVMNIIMVYVIVAFEWASVLLRLQQGLLIESKSVF